MGNGDFGDFGDRGMAEKPIGRNKKIVILYLKDNFKLILF